MELQFPLHSMEFRYNKPIRNSFCAESFGPWTHGKRGNTFRRISEGNPNGGILMTNITRRTKIARMTLLAMLEAVLIVLAYVNIPMPMGLSITFNMIPVAVAVMAMGMPGGMIIGGAFGLISFLQCFGVFGSSALGAVLVRDRKSVV